MCVCMCVCLCVYACACQRVGEREVVYVGVPQYVCGYMFDYFASNSVSILKKQVIEYEDIGKLHVYVCECALVCACLCAYCCVRACVRVCTCACASVRARMCVCVRVSNMRHLCDEI